MTALNRPGQDRPIEREPRNLTSYVSAVQEVYGFDHDYLMASTASRQLNRAEANRDAELSTIKPGEMVELYDEGRTTDLVYLLEGQPHCSCVKVRFTDGRERLVPEQYLVAGVYVGDDILTNPKGGKVRHGLLRTGPDGQLLWQTEFQECAVWGRAPKNEDRVRVLSTGCPLEVIEVDSDGRPRTGEPLKVIAVAGDGFSWYVPEENLAEYRGEDLAEVLEIFRGALGEGPSEG